MKKLTNTPKYPLGQRRNHKGKQKIILDEK